ncbi:MAG: recombinase RecT [Nitrobacter sp.]
MPLAPRFEQVLDGTMKVERLMRTIVLSVERLPKLLDCTRQSLFNAAMSAAVLGLEVDGVTGQAYLIPFKGSAQLVIGYKGFNTLAARSGITITGAVVREGDEFDYELGSAAYVRHKPKTGPTKDRRIIAAWACAQSMTRPAVISVMNIDELMAVKTKSPGGARSDSPWNDPNIGFPAMCEKTVKRRLSRSMPLNVMQLAARMDEAVDEQGKTAWISPDKTIVVDGEFSDMPARNNETPTVEALTSPARTTPRAAAPAQSPSSPGTPAEQGAAVIPTAAEYVERWAVIVSGAADAKQLHTTWADQKGERDVIVWTDEHPFAVLKERVEKAIEFLKR